MRITIRTEYRSHPTTGAGQLRCWAPKMRRTYGYPHEMNRERGRFYVLGQFVRVWERKNEARLNMVAYLGDGCATFEVFDQTVKIGDLDSQREALKLNQDLEKTNYIP